MHTRMAYSRSLAIVVPLHHCYTIKRLYMYLFIGITLGFGVVLVLGALGVLGDLLAPVACKVHLSREQNLGNVNSKHRIRS
jgi:hypothetical protein